MVATVCSRAAGGAWLVLGTWLGLGGCTELKWRVDFCKEVGNLWSPLEGFLWRGPLEHSGVKFLLLKE